MSVALAKEAEFGRFPFDLFAIEKWDREAESTLEERKRQWEKLAWDYQRLTLIERWPYYKQTWSENTPAASQDEAERILGNNQTPAERNMSLGSCQGGFKRVWLRTCYDPTIAEK
ncbi:uncharacterized protein N7479_004101 [Penicillium vulpinum]|uniref:uncharacterized protein n=1 Tax=Penicillium vulpinum TaxID=29845 RepID=UPI0025496F4B|nr:uncharacterized protein N7479_004101 [Penicillium vulpinum]KAJ5964225.1 hypothetical protein N7479_004101 [Penicillium vulpinum]